MIRILTLLDLARAGGWKTLTAALMAAALAANQVALQTTGAAFFPVEYEQAILFLAGALGLLGIAHKSEKTRKAITETMEAFLAWQEVLQVVRTDETTRVAAVEHAQVLQEARVEAIQDARQEESRNDPAPAPAPIVVVVGAPAAVLPPPPPVAPNALSDTEENLR